MTTPPWGPVPEPPARPLDPRHPAPDPTRSWAFPSSSAPAPPTGPRTETWSAGGPPVPPPPAAPTWAPDPGAPPSPPAPSAPVRPPARGRGVALVLAAALVLGASGGAGFAATSALVGDDDPAATTSTPIATVGDLDPGTEPVAAVAQALGPAVVQIETGRALGSGFVYDADEGLVLTAAHVVDGASRVAVRLADGRRVDGTVLGADAATDVAVVRVEADGLTAAALAVDDEVQVGQLAVAIGSPFGLDQTVTSGIVSAVDRSVETPGGVVPMIQTDAPINSGNSGGALADRQGRVIGINDSIASESGGNVGVGFAIPIATAKSVADRIVAVTLGESPAR